MLFDLQLTLAPLHRTPSTLRTLLVDFPHDWTHANYGPDTFSPFDVVGHLIHADLTNWLPRIRHILDHGTSQPFPVFDRYAMFANDHGKPINDLLDSFVSVRRQSLADVQQLALTPAMLAQRGLHPDLGEVTIQQLLATWVVHDLGHIHQIVKAMAYQCREEVGPWRQFLTILPK